MGRGLSADIADFSFDAWRELAERDLQAFFRQRKRIIDDFITRSGEHAPALRALQESIDALRVTAGTPIKAVRGIAALMEGHLQAVSTQFRVLNEELATFRTAADRLSRLSEAV